MCRSARAFCIWWRSSIGRAVRCWPGACRTRWTHRTACLRSKGRPWHASAGLRSSIPTRAASSPASPSPARWPPPASGSRWTVAGAGWTTCSSSGCALPQIRGHLSQGLSPRGKAGIAPWIEFYNFLRPHQALEDRAPMAVWRASVNGAFGEEAVDMTLLASEKLGQRCALPTSLQPQQLALCRRI
ncbi:Putative transposase [Bradyrhizobium vignae]|uniref:Transposase n=1 Tax=Bradyrhizobium vignae TaxID=1549949 RepID=A0A2U3QA84_9BRAD|nr:Putative transposase [Bradyrhizobium vignae]